MTNRKDDDDDDDDDDDNDDDDDDDDDGGGGGGGGPFFSRLPIFLDQSLQHTDFAPLFTQLTNELPHFAPPLQIALHKFPFFRALCAIFTPIFGLLRPLFGLRPGATALLCPLVTHWFGSMAVRVPPLVTFSLVCSVLTIN